MPRRLSFEEACRRYVHRYTVDHIPEWARNSRPCDHGGTETRYYAPHFRSDREWYDNTRFPGEAGYMGQGGDCYTTGATWPFGQWLVAPPSRAYFSNAGKTNSTTWAAVVPAPQEDA